MIPHKLLFNTVLAFLLNAFRKRKHWLYTLLIMLTASTIYFAFLCCDLRQREAANARLKMISQFDTDIDEFFVKMTDECGVINENEDAFCYVVFFVFSNDGFKVSRSGAKIEATNTLYNINKPIVASMQWNSEGDKKKCLLEFISDQQIFINNANKGLQYFSKQDIKLASPKLFGCLQAVSDFDNIDGWYMILTADKNNNVVWGTGIAKRTNFNSKCNTHCQNNLDNLIKNSNQHIIRLLVNLNLANFDDKILKHL